MSLFLGRLPRPATTLDPLTGSMPPTFSTSYTDYGLPWRLFRQSFRVWFRLDAKEELDEKRAEHEREKKEKRAG